MKGTPGALSTMQNGLWAHEGYTRGRCLQCRMGYGPKKGYTRDAVCECRMGYGPKQTTPGTSSTMQNGLWAKQRSTRDVVYDMAWARVQDKPVRVFSCISRTLVEVETVVL